MTRKRRFAGGVHIDRRSGSGWASQAPFQATGTIAVKVINHHGDEILKTYEIY
jgi:hypothetical protein